MDEKPNSSIYIIVIIVIAAGIWIWSNNNEIKRLQTDNVYLEDRLSEYQSALEEANTNIGEVNSRIDDAKFYTWDSYDEMGEALENLETVDTVSEP